MSLNCSQAPSDSLFPQPFKFLHDQRLLPPPWTPSCLSPARSLLSRHTGLLALPLVVAILAVSVKATLLPTSGPQLPLYPPLHVAYPWPHPAHYNILKKAFPDCIIKWPSLITFSIPSPGFILLHSTIMAWNYTSNFCEIFIICLPNLNVNLMMEEIFLFLI